MIHGCGDRHPAWPGARSAGGGLQVRWGGSMAWDKKPASTPRAESVFGPDPTMHGAGKVSVCSGSAATPQSSPVSWALPHGRTAMACCSPPGLRDHEFA